MTHPVLLEPQEHRNLRIITRRSAAYGDDVQYCLTFPLEFRNVQACYPIVFRRIDDAPRWEALALFGLDKGENLFLGPDGEGWQASYLPLVMARQPFMIGLGEGGGQIHVDLDHPRVRFGDGEGEALFLKYGGTTAFMEQIETTMNMINQCLLAQQRFYDAVEEAGLLVPFASDELQGFHGLDIDRLASLPPATLGNLNRDGHLEAIYMANASLSNLRLLARLKEHRHASHA